MTLKLMIGKFFYENLHKTPQGVDCAFETLNRISSKHSKKLKNAIDEYIEYENSNTTYKNNYENNGD